MIGPVVEVRGELGQITIPLELLRRRPLGEVGAFLAHLTESLTRPQTPYLTALEMPTILPCAPRVLDRPLLDRRSNAALG